MNLTGNQKRDDQLDQVLNPFLDDERIEGIAVAGSISTGTFTEYSDFDILILIKKEHYSSVQKEIHLIAKNIPGYVIGAFYDSQNEDTYWFYIDEELLNVDYFLLTEETLKPKFYHKDILIVKDESGYLNKIKGESKTEPEVEELNQEDLKKWILALRGDFHYAPKKYVKGDKIEGIENIKWMMKQLINFKYRLKGKHLWDWRHALKILNEEELRIYSVVSRLGLKTEDLEIGLKENWKLMKDIDKHYSNLYNEEPFPDFDKVLWKRINKLIEISHRQED